MDSLSLFRRRLGNDLGALAEEHYRHDLTESDRTALQSAARQASIYTTIGTAAGLGLGCLAAFRIRQSRARVFAAFKAAEKPTQVVFADGRSEAIPDMTKLVRPSRMGGAATYLFFGLGGTVIGEQIGLATGIFSAKRSISQEPESRDRIVAAFRRFRVDQLRTQASKVEKEQLPFFGF